MITLQANIDTRPVKVDWYWNNKKKQDEDNKLNQINPFYIIKETSYPWEAANW